MLPLPPPRCGAPLHCTDALRRLVAGVGRAVLAGYSALSPLPSALPTAAMPQWGHCQCCSNSAFLYLDSLATMPLAICTSSTDLE